MRQQEPLPLAERIDLDRFMGKWYVIGSIPGALDPVPFNSIQEFARAERGIRIDYTFNAGSAAGEEKRYSTRAMVADPGFNTEWEVTYAWLFDSDYKILHVEPDYSMAMIGHPNRRNVWILARRPNMEDAFYSDIILHLQGLGYNIGKIRRIPHG